MKKITVCRKSSLTEGGCNACGPVNSVIYELEIAGIKRTIEEWSIENIVQCVVVAANFQVEDVYQMFSEFRVFKKDQQTVKLISDSDILDYDSGETTFQVNQQTILKSEIYTVVNTILSQIFKLETFEFKEVKETPIQCEAWQETIEQQQNNSYLFE